MMNSLFNTFLYLNLIGTFTYLLFKLINRILRNQMNEQFRYLCCIIILFVYLIPFYQLLPTSSISKESIHTTNTTVSMLFTNNNLNFTNPIRNNSFLIEQSIQNYVVIIWLIGATLLSLWYFFTFLSFRKKLYTSQDLVVSYELQHQADLCAKAYGIKQTPILKVSSFVTTPMLIGFFKPIIVLPNQSIPLTEAEWIFKHELIHFKRHDLWFKCFGLFVKIIHWYQPIIWFLWKEFEFYIETSCDEAVVHHLTIEERKQYGHLLISYVQIKQPIASMVGITFSPETNQLKRRIYIMLNGKKTQKLFIAAMLGILISGSFALSTFAAGNKDIISESSSTVENTNENELNDNQIQKEFDSDCNYRSKSGGRRHKNCKHYRNNNTNQNRELTRSSCCK